ncbi:MAG: DUF1592 domain-containing protein [Lentisphaerales bacterium]|nr:DUF1592 domain-containing protein [Lentisphaerales bacterium]
MRLSIFIFLIFQLCSTAQEFKAIIPFIKDNCIDCHDAEMMEGNLNLENLDLHDPSKYNNQLLAKIYDQVDSGKMPPPKKKKKKVLNPDRFLLELSQHILTQDKSRRSEYGRVETRRLNKSEIENTLKDYFGKHESITFPAIPNDPEFKGYSKSAEALGLSPLLIKSLLSTASKLLNDTANWQRGSGKKVATQKISIAQATQQKKIVPLINGISLIKGWTAPLIDQQVAKIKYENRNKYTLPKKEYDVAVFRANCRLYNATVPTFKAKKSGTYKLSFKAYNVLRTDNNYNKGSSGLIKKVAPGLKDETVTILTQDKNDNYRLLKTVKVYKGKTNTVTAEFWLNRGEQIIFNCVNLPIPENPVPLVLAKTMKEGFPGVAFGSFEISWASQSQNPADKISILPTDETNATEAETQLLHNLGRLFRRPLKIEENSFYLNFFKTHFTRTKDIRMAAISTLETALSSPAFLFLETTKGKLNSWQMINRLSYFLWNSPPDHELFELAQKHKYLSKEILAQQAERMIADKKFDRFITEFSNNWLELDKVSDTIPDFRLYPEYRGREYLIDSAVTETQLFLKHLIQNNLPVANLVTADFAIVNEELAKHYGIQGVHAVDFQIVDLPKTSLRGGLLTQAAILKLTADGTTTSPILRGVWINEKILGVHISPPPPNLPSAESDIRGLSTIKDILSAHMENKSCRSCHKTIDPPGFALESFDVMGAFRENYRSLEKGSNKTSGMARNGKLFTYYQSYAVDSSSIVSEQTFTNINEFKQIVSKDPKKIAKNILNELVYFSSGKPLEFIDLSTAEQILKYTKQDGYRLKSLIKELITSKLFMEN